MDEVLVIWITAPSQEVCTQIAKHLLEERLIACANILPTIRSMYRWEGEIQNEQEALMVCKARVRSFKKLCSFVKKHHPYELPEIIALPVKDGLPEYLRWVLEETTPEPKTGSV
ncbi:MAG: divalent-cation tolerance protein CutA [Anaerolineaceae bacterium]|nr:divalent-cation tolerance protein CutA [Anaerolineaceae bacterium]